MIALARVDERLIHGQVAYAWSIAYPSDAIIVVDEPSSKDDMQKALLRLTVLILVESIIKREENNIPIPFILTMIQRISLLKFMILELTSMEEPLHQTQSSIFIQNYKEAL